MSYYCDRVDCPSPRQHDNETAYRLGCRSEAAHAHSLLTAKRRRVGRHPAAIVDPTGTMRRLQALGALGWTAAELGARLGVSSRAVTQLRSGRYRTHVRNAEKVRALYDELSMLPGPSSRCVVLARRHGWAAPLAWDERSIDDPAASPHRPADEITSTVTERAARVAELTARGATTPQIAEALHLHPRTVVAIRARVRRSGDVETS